MHAYVDRDGDGWRDLPDGKRLRLEIRMSADGKGRMLSEELARALKIVGLRTEFLRGFLIENPKAARASHLEPGIARP